MSFESASCYCYRLIKDEYLSFIQRGSEHTHLRYKHERVSDGDKFTSVMISVTLLRKKAIENRKNMIKEKNPSKFDKIRNIHPSKGGCKKSFE